MNDTTRSGGSIIELRGISKSFSGAKALDNVDFSCRSGSTHAILGENGAGKSTLIKIMSGVLQPDRGAIYLNGRRSGFARPQRPQDPGLSVSFRSFP